MGVPIITPMNSPQKDHDQVRKAFDVGETGLKLRPYFENTFGLVLRAQR
jgi:hypothetical protein